MDKGMESCAFRPLRVRLDRWFCRVRRVDFSDEHIHSNVFHMRPPC